MSTEIRKWADGAMFESEPMPFDVNKTGPRVHLLSMNSDPLGTIASTCKMYKGEVVRSLSEVTNKERRTFVREVLNTRLRAPFEFVKFHFMIEGVTRSFTHQMVRQRTAVYAQESLRFAVKDNLGAEIALPPSLAGLPDDDPKIVMWENAVEAVEDSYFGLVNSGTPAEDARGLLPHNITTRLHYSTDLRALLDHAGNRLCTQAQFEWRQVFSLIANAIREYRPHAALVEHGHADRVLLEHLDSHDSWQFSLLAGVFAPVCYATGKCEFMASFDRPCSIRDRVEANHRIGRASSEWGQDNFQRGNVGQKFGSNGEEFIGAIHPAEWLLDASAARL